MIIQKLSKEECLQFLKEIRFGRLGCARHKQPYVVPIYFASDDKHLYGFTTLGQKIRWMRENPLVCVEADLVIDHLRWTSVVVLGKYQELDQSSSPGLREYALELLQHRTMWWQPAVLSTRDSESGHGGRYIFYRVRIDEISGRRAGPASPGDAIPQPRERVESLVVHPGFDSRQLLLRRQQ